MTGADAARQLLDVSAELGTDQRDFARESLEEVADALVYAACGLMRAAGQGPA